MQSYHRVPLALFQSDLPLPFHVYALKNERLEIFAKRGATIPWGVCADGELGEFFVRERDLKNVYCYAGQCLDSIMTDSTIPDELKAMIFYTSAAETMQLIFNDPRTELIGQMHTTVRALVRSLSCNQKILEDLFKITAHDYYTYTHSLNVGIFATALAMKYFGASLGGLTALERFSYGFFLHDIGKSLIPKDIINKPSQLAEHEWALVRKHPEYGYNILMQAAYLTDEAAYITLEHHEQYNGSGYPYGRKGNQIHPCARICAIADAFDALTTVRAYKKALSPYEALKLMQQDMQFEFDYDFLQAFIQMLGPRA